MEFHDRDINPSSYHMISDSVSSENERGVAACMSHSPLWFSFSKATR